VRITLAIVAVSILTTGQVVDAEASQSNSTESSTVSDAPKLSEADALRIAATEARHRKMHIQGYEATSATFSRNDKGEGTWLVYFLNKDIPIDGCFFMMVDDRTGKVSHNVLTCG
jgi:hypothetical protein